MVGGADEARLRRLGEAERGEELRLLGRGELGDLRLEGKEYVVQDGDLLNIRFAV